jgi:ketosteroid isomerase-like protein
MVARRVGRSRTEAYVVESRPVDVVRRFYAAVAERDLDAAGACFAAAAAWVLPGDSSIAGAHRGWAAIRDEFLAKLGPLSRRPIPRDQWS